MEALTVLQTVAIVMVIRICWNGNVAGDTELVQTTAVSVLKKISEQFSVDIVDEIIAKPKFMELFMPVWWNASARLS